MRIRLHNCFASVLAILACSPCLLAQPAKNAFYLHDGDTVVFYGDSITEQRYYSQWVEVYTVTRFPHMQVQFFNAGVGGDPSRAEAPARSICALRAISFRRSQAW